MAQQLRLELQTILEGILGIPDNVYFQPPENVTLQYPCIVYSRDNAYRADADNLGYLYKQRYQVTLIDRKPDNPAVDVLGSLPYAAYSRNFVADGLNHDVFEIYH